MITDEPARLLTRLGAPTIDRRLAGERAKLTARGTMLKSQVPIRTRAQWDDADPGRGSRPAGHEDGCSFGEFGFTLTDIATRCTVNRSAAKSAIAATLDPHRTAPHLCRSPSCQPLRVCVYVFTYTCYVELAKG